MKKDAAGCDVETMNFNPFEMLLAKARYILLYDDINSCSAKEVVTKLLGMSIENAKRPIYLEINSCGGEVSAGIAIMNTIKNLPNPVVTIINGEADSMAGFISVVGDKRYITETSYWMGHPLQDAVGGTTQTILDRGLFLKRLETDLDNIFKEKTKLTPSEFKKMLRGELWLSAEECLHKGIVDDIIKAPIGYSINNKKRNKQKKSKK